MSREKTFRFEFTVSNEFLTASPAAEAWIRARQAEIAHRKTATGPRGGLYRLDPTEQLIWQASQDGEHYFIRNIVRFATRRKGRYVPPSRITPDLLPPDSMTFETFTLPVNEGVALLPDGRRVETPSPFVDVPVPR